MIRLLFISLLLFMNHYLSSFAEENTKQNQSTENTKATPSSDLKKAVVTNNSLGFINPYRVSSFSENFLSAGETIMVSEHGIKNNLQLVVKNGKNAWVPMYYHFSTYPDAFALQNLLSRMRKFTNPHEEKSEEENKTNTPVSVTPNKINIREEREKSILERNKEMSNILCEYLQRTPIRDDIGILINAEAVKLQDVWDNDNQDCSNGPPEWKILCNQNKDTK